MKPEGSTTRIIACGVFRPAIEHLEIENRHPYVSVSFLPPRLHLDPGRLEKELAAEVAAACERGERVLCLYGECFPEIDEFCSRRGVSRIRGLHCYEMLLGDEAYRRIVEEAAGTFFLEQDLVRNFDEYCVEPLELHDEEMRDAQFGHYRRLLYVRQPSDPELTAMLSRISDLLHLPCETRYVDYAHIETRLEELVDPKRSE
jgi:hypothetical protein